MSKTTGKLKYDLALSTTSVYDASSIYINKSAELNIDGNARLQYQTIGATYSDNNEISMIPIPKISSELGKAYFYIRNLGPIGATGAAPIHISYGVGAANTTERSTPVGLPAEVDVNQLSSLNVGEFAFLPILTGATTLSMRSGFIAGSTYWAGATYNDIEYMLCFTDHNVGPEFITK